MKSRPAAWILCLAFASALTAASAGSNEEPNPVMPVVWSGEAQSREAGIIDLKIHYRLFDTWYLYISAPKTSPYGVTQIDVKLPAGASFAGEWARPPVKALEPGVMIADRDGAFIRRVKLAANAKGVIEIPVTVTWQTCNPEQCLPTETRTIVVKARAGVQG